MTPLSSPARLPWTKAEVAKLKRLHGKLTEREIADRIGRSFGAVQSKARTLGLPASNSHKLGPEHDDEIRRLHGEGRHDAAIAKAMHLNVCTVQARRKRLGLPAVPQYVRPRIPEADRSLVRELAGDRGWMGQGKRIAREFKARTGRQIGEDAVTRIILEAEFPWEGQPRDTVEVWRRAHLILAKYPREGGPVPWTVPGVRVRDEVLRAMCEG